MKWLINALTKLGLLNEDLDYHLIRGSMVVLFLFFGYQKWFEYEAQVLIPYISNGPLIFWMYPVFGIRGASWVLGMSEWSFAVLLFLGFWHKRLGVLGALGSCAAFLGTATIIPFMKDVVLFAVSVYLLKQDVARVSRSAPQSELVLERASLGATR